MTSDPSIDLMELADIGGQPKKLAYEIHRQLRDQYKAVPLPVPLAGIARAVGIMEIVEHETEAFEGALIINGEKGAIALRQGMRRGRKRFTLGHEIGHFVNPFHRLSRTNFQCNVRDMVARRASSRAWEERPILERIEVEANEFSNALLLPGPEFREERKALGNDVDIGQIVQLARRIGVSFEVMAKTYVETARDKIAVVTSRNGVVSRVIPPREFPFLGLKKGAPLPHASLTRKFCGGHPSGSASALSEVPTWTWLERQGAVTALYEQVLVQSDGHAMTLLMVDEEEADDEADDRNWNRSNRKSH